MSHRIPCIQKNLYHKVATTKIVAKFYKNPILFIFFFNCGYSRKYKCYDKVSINIFVTSL